MLEIFKSVLVEGMQIVKTKETSDKYKITVKFLNTTTVVDLNKTCTPTYELQYCKGAVATALSSIYLDLKDIAHTRFWLDRVNGKY